MLRYVCLAATMVGSIAAADPAPRPAKPYTGTVEALAVDAAKVNAGWKRRPGIIVEDPANPPKVKKKQEKALAEILETIAAQDLRACGDFAYAPAGEDFDVLTLRVAVFKSKEAAEKWWQTVYRSHRCEERYRPIDGYGDEAVDSLRTNARIVRQGNVVLTCCQSTGWDASHRLLGEVCAKIRSICAEPEAVTSQPAGVSDEDE